MKPLNTATIAGAKKFARKLLATTCLTAAGAAAASASTISEPPEFGKSFAVATPLAAGIDRVQGRVSFTGSSVDNDYFKFSGLLGGSAYSIAGTYTGSASYAVKTSGGVDLNPSSDNPASFMGTVPGDGILVIAALFTESTGTYDLTLAATSTVPEPSTLAGVGLGLASAFALRRKLTKK